MTGMGSDGAEALALAKRSADCTAIAEAEETCVVFGMLRSAIETGAVDHVVPLHRIAAKIVDVAGLTARFDL